MPFPVPQFRPPPLPEPTPIVRIVERGDVQWNRPIFKAPPLEVYPQFLSSRLPDVPPSGASPSGETTSGEPAP